MSSKALPKAKLAPKKVMVTILSSAARLIQILAKPLQLRSMLSKSMRCTKTCYTCSWYWSTEKWAQFFSTTTPDHRSHKPKAQSMDHEMLPHLPYSPDLSPTDDHFLQASQQLFVGKMLPQLARGRKCSPRVHWIPKQGFLYYRNKSTYFSLAKMCCL